MAKKYIFWFVAFLLIFQIMALAEEALAPVNARQVMLKFVESQSKLNSYIIKSNTKATFSYTGFNNNKPGTSYRHSDARFDGDRVKEGLTNWGDINNGTMDLAKEDVYYTSWMWDGERGYELSILDKIALQTAKRPGTVQIYEEGSTHLYFAKETYKRTMISPAQGYVIGNGQDIGTMFLRADAKVKLLDKRSKVNGVDCYVIEAEVPKGGKYKVWIDPVHGFNLARLRSRRNTGDLYYGRPLKKDVYWNNFYKVLEFQEVSGVWLPKTFKTRANGQDGGYDFAFQEELITEIYEVNLDPDHDKEGSFLTDDILNGTQVRLEGVPLDVILTWQDGKVIDENGREVDLEKKLNAKNKK